MIPWCRFHIIAAIFFPIDIWLISQDSSALFLHIGHSHEGADIEAYAVVEVGIPSDGLFFDRFPAHKDVVGCFACKDKLQLFLESFSGSKSLLRAIDTTGDVLLLAVDPIAHIGVDKGLQILAVELVVIDQHRKSIWQAVPNMPDEGAVMKELAVLGEELIS